MIAFTVEARAPWVRLADPTEAKLVAGGRRKVEWAEHPESATKFDPALIGGRVASIVHPAWVHDPVVVGARRFGVRLTLMRQGDRLDRIFLGAETSWLRSWSPEAGPRWCRTVRSAKWLPEDQSFLRYAPLSEALGEVGLRLVPHDAAHQMLVLGAHRARGAAPGAG